MNKLLGKLLCLIEEHSMTNKTEQGIKPTAEDVANLVESFAEYSKLYCARPGCKWVYRLDREEPGKG